MKFASTSFSSIPNQVAIALCVGVLSAGAAWARGGAAPSAVVQAVPTTAAAAPAAAVQAAPAAQAVAPVQVAAGPTAAPAAAVPAKLSLVSPEPIRVLLAPELETTLSSPVAARITSLNATLGARFNAGQTLVSFNCQESVARKGIADAELSAAVEQHEAKVRMQGLEQASDVEVAVAASAVAKAKSQLMLQQAQVSQCSVSAPWAGRIAKVHARNFMTVSAGQPLVDLVKTGPLKLKLNVPSKWLAQIRVGSVFDVAIDETGKTYQARVAAINSRIDPVSQTIELEASMAQAYPELLAGMSGVANMAGIRQGN
jgi:membrane fusion protein, multidrug efflux system